MNPVLNLMKYESRIDQDFLETLKMIFMLTPDVNLAEKKDVRIKVTVKEDSFKEKNKELMIGIQRLISPYFLNSSKYSNYNLKKNFSTGEEVNETYEDFVHAIKNNSFYGTWSSKPVDFYLEKKKKKEDLTVIMDQSFNIYEFLIFKLNQNLLRNYSANKKSLGLSKPSVIPVFDKSSLEEEQNKIIDSLIFLKDKAKDSGENFIFPNMSFGVNSITTASSALLYLFLHQELSDENRKKILNNKDLMSEITGKELVFQQSGIWDLLFNEKIENDLKNIMKEFPQKTVENLVRSLIDSKNKMEKTGKMPILLLKEVIERNQDITLTEKEKTDLVGIALKARGKTLFKETGMDDKEWANEIKKIFTENDESSELTNLEKHFNVEDIEKDGQKVLFHLIQNITDEYKVGKIISKVATYSMFNQKDSKSEQFNRWKDKINVNNENIVGIVKQLMINNKYKINEVQIAVECIRGKLEQKTLSNLISMDKSFLEILKPHCLEMVLKKEINKNNSVDKKRETIKMKI